MATGFTQSAQSLSMMPYVTWSSSAPSVASVSSTGLAQASAQGVAVISATYASVSGSTTVTVGPPSLTSITVTPTNPGMPAGAYQQFTATLNYSNGSNKDTTGLVTWSSSSASIASISNSGMATTLTAGSTTITATSGSVSGSTTLSVSAPQCVTAPPGLTNWWTGDGNTVDIAGSNSGTLQSGATYGSGEVGQGFSFGGSGASLLINAPVYSPTAGTLMFWFLAAGVGPEVLTGGFAGGQNRAPGFSLDSAGNLSWEFANLHGQPAGQVNSNQWNHVALTYSTANGETTVNVYLNGVLSSDAVTDVNNSWNPRVVFGAYLGAQQPSFNGSLDEIAIFNQALSAQQIQQVYNAFSGGMCKPRLQSITVSPPTPSVPLGFSLQFDAVGTYSDSSSHDVTTSSNWSSENTGVATISTGALATAVASGTSTISATLGSVQGSTNLTVGPSLVSIQVAPQNPSLDVGTVQQLTATGTFSDGTQQSLTTKVRWSTSAATVASVASSGLLTGIGVGQAQITATAGPVSGSTQVTVNSATLSSITLSPANATIVRGAVLQFTATGTFSDGTQQNLTTTVSWSSSATNVATIAGSGLASALSTGTTTITATLGAISGNTSLTVTSAVLSALEITPLSPSVVIGNSQQFSATAFYSNGTSSNATASVTWSSSAATVATMSTSTPGLAVSTGTGESIISASWGAVTASTTLTVEDQLASIAITPSISSAALGNTEQFAAVGTYTSGITQNLTNSVTWTSSAPAVATISTSGLATTLTSGQTTIGATLGNISASASLTVMSTDPLGSASATSTACPAGVLSGTCYAVTLSCPNINDLTGYMKVTYPSGTPVGTVLFSTGANGTYLYETLGKAPELLNVVLQAGFTVAQISWGDPFTTDQPYGWQTGPGGIRAVACRYATLAQWIYQNIHLANTAAPFCATGNSGGAELIGLAMAHYGVGSIFALIESTGGPDFTRLDWACDGLQPPALNLCGNTTGFGLSQYSAMTFVDPAYTGPLCSEEVETHSTTNDPTFLHDSVTSPDATLNYPNTFVNFLYGALDTSTAPNQAQIWESAITSSKAESCVANTAHGVPDSTEGAQQIENDILQYCTMPAGSDNTRSRPAH
jgi:trimeric autotransporter adhesin